MTNKESHIVEFKQNWRDDYLKVLSAFANSKGGTYYKLCNGGYCGYLTDKLNVNYKVD